MEEQYNHETSGIPWTMEQVSFLRQQLREYNYGNHNPLNKAVFHRVSEFQWKTEHPKWVLFRVIHEPTGDYFWAGEKGHVKDISSSELFQIYI